MNARIDAVEQSVEELAGRPDWITHVIGAGAPTDRRAFVGTGNLDGIWSTPRTHTFTKGVEVIYTMIPEQPPTEGWFAEAHTIPDDDEETTGHDVTESAAKSGDSEFGNQPLSLNLFGEHIPAGSDGESAAARIDVATGLPYGLRYTVMDLQQMAVAEEDDLPEVIEAGERSIWIRMQHPLDDGGVYVTHPPTGWVFRRLDKVVHPDLTSIESRGSEHWIAKNFYGALERVIVRDGFGGPLVVAADAAVTQPGSTAFVDAAGKTWTAASGASIRGTEAERIGALESDGWVTLLDGTPLELDAASIQVYLSDLDLKIIRYTINVRSTRNAITDTLRMTINNSAANIYSTSAGAPTTALAIGTVPGQQTNQDRFACIEGRLALRSGQVKTGSSLTPPITSTSTTVPNPVPASHGIFDASAVETIELFMTTGQIAAGTSIIIEGR